MLPLEDFHEIFIYEYFSTIGKIQVSFKSDENHGYFTWRGMYIYDISLISS